tara:strand:- start:105282 stop:106289 length:1008 start_codon:yes stop_codon:yes gene_type:complete
MDIIDNVEAFKSNHLHLMLDNFISLQHVQFANVSREFSFSNNIDNYTSPTFLDNIRFSQKREFFYALGTNFERIISHKEFCKFCFEGDSNIFTRLLAGLLRFGYEKAALNCLDYYISRHDLNDDWVLSSFISLAFVSPENIARHLVKSDKFILAPDLCQKMISVLYRIPTQEIPFLNYDSLGLMVEYVEKFHVTALPFMNSNKLTAFVISKVRNSKLSARITALWIKDFAATTNDVANMLHYDLFKNSNHLHLYIFNLIDEIFNILDINSAQKFAYELLCSCRVTFTDCNLPQMRILNAKNISVGQFKHIFQLFFFQCEGVMTNLYNEKQGVDVA